jgi:hypothetical protein
LESHDSPAGRSLQDDQSLELLFPGRQDMGAYGGAVDVEMSNLCHPLDESDG